MITFFKKHLWIVSALLAGIIFFIASWIGGTNPFTGGMIISGDLMTQYLSFFQYFRHVVFGGFSDFSYSFSNGLGGNTAGNWGYYLTSPFNLIALLFPANEMTLALYTIIVTKVMLAAGAFTYMLNKLNPIKQELMVAMSLCYALSSYVICYSGNIMWLDSIALLPLVLIGLTKICHGKFSILYVASLAVLIIANYYTAYMVCLFLIGYFLYQAYLNFSTWKLFFKQTFIFALSSITAALLTAFIEIPTFLNLIENKLSVQSYYSPISHLQLWLDIPANLFFQGAFNVYIPLIYTGSLTLILAILYFFNKKFSLKNRIATFLILLFTCSGLLTTKLYFIWHAGQAPNSYPYRFAFLINFIIVYIACLQLKKNTLNKKQVIICSTLTALLFIVGSYSRISLYKRWGVSFNFEELIASLVVLIIVILTYTLYSLKKIRPLILSSLIILELFANASYLFATNKGAVVITTTKPAPANYSSYTKSTQKLINALPASAKDERLEKSFVLDQDRGEAYTFNYRGATVFSSNNNSNVSILYSQLGLQGLYYFYFYNTGTQVTDALFGIKTYLVSTLPTDSIAQYGNYGLRNDLKNKTIIYQDKYHTAYSSKVFPLAFSGQLPTNTILRGRYGALLNQTLAINALTGSNYTYFGKAIKAKLTAKTASIKSDSDYSYLSRKDSKAIILTATYQAKPNSTGYIMLDQNLMKLINRDGSVDKLTLNGQNFTSMQFANQPIGVTVPKSGTVSLKIYFKPSITQFKLMNPNLYLLNEQNLQKVIKKANQNKMQLTTLRGNKIDGTVTIKKGQSLVTTIPYSWGWKAKVDGKIVPISKSFGIFMALKLSPGTHNVEFTHTMPGLKLGLLITLIGLIIFVFEIIYFKKKQ
ncbi:YfhO family protein [Lactobacillus psittaci]|uniref:Bacterial membrane protein YfhO n=1 Tax=Lactobacillus psittaci DSM 15354 TaxID=1122152 RepID=A0A0R1S2G0_9LACO|nr:YfhO family protein [Lactobacillus psittaci]KRL63271.1 bacterial membrane protein YfhO [Lactobacillus psittaci DSM 15354]